jgi:dephospho-CoA kinase
VTGGIGSGKTAVCAEFERLGRKVLYADAIAREIQESDPQIKRRITSLLGKEAYTGQGSLNRRFVANAIFSDSKLREGLNAIVHPAVLGKLDRAIASDSTMLEEPYVLIEAALIYESGLDRKLDAVLVVDAPLETRVARVSKRDGLDEEAVLARIRSQEAAQKLRLKADVLLHNTGDLTEIRSKICFLDSIFRQI